MPLTWGIKPSPPHQKYANAVHEFEYSETSWKCLLKIDSGWLSSRELELLFIIWGPLEKCQFLRILEENDVELIKVCQSSHFPQGVELTGH